MKNRLILFLIVITVFPVISSYSQQQGKKGNLQNNITGVLESVEINPLSETEKEGLKFMFEEEKLARDLYYFLYEKWNTNTFKNIAESEQTHMDTIEFLLVRYEVSYDKNQDTGIFTDPELQKLYNTLTGKGKLSFEKGLETALLVEEKDIKDLIDEISGSDNTDIKIAYQNLLKGSRNHLRSFSKQLEKTGGKYKPEFIDTKEFERIRNSEMERGGIITDPEFSY